MSKMSKFRAKATLPRSDSRSNERTLTGPEAERPQGGGHQREVELADEQAEEHRDALPHQDI